jgi:hypothetical protein
MNKTLLIAGIAIMLAGAFVTIGSSGIVQSAQACPGKGAGASSQGSTTTNNLSVHLTPRSTQFIAGQSA